MNLNRLPIEINEEIEIPCSYYQDTSIDNISKLKVNGIIKENLMNEIVINVNIKGNLILKDSVTLDLISYPLDLNIEENLDENIENNQKYYKNMQNTLDKLEFLWENIILEVPIAYTKHSGKTISGDGWCLNGNEEKLDSRFSKLNEIFKGGE